MLLRRIAALVTAYCLLLTAVLPATGAALPRSHLGPIASATVSTVRIGIGKTVTFDASASRTARGDNYNLSYRLDATGEFKWTDWQGTPTFTHTYTAAGRFSARIQVKDSSGLIDETVRLITIESLSKAGDPVGSFTYSPKEQGTTDTIYTFTPQVHSGIGTAKEKLRIRWSFTGDTSAWDTEWLPPVPVTHLFPYPGSFTVGMAIRDIDGSETIYRPKLGDQVTVKSGTAPESSLTVYPVTSSLGGAVHFDASKSKYAATYRFDYEGDGKWDTLWTKKAVAQFIYPRVGDYRPLVEIKTADGDTDTTEGFVTVTDNTWPKKQALYPVFTVQNQTENTSDPFGVQGDSFLFSTYGSSTQGSNLTLTARFDFTGDGRWDTDFGDLSATYRITQAGQYRPRAEIRNSEGTSIVIATTIRVVANTKPVARIQVFPKVGTVSDSYTVSATGSFDGQSPAQHLRIRFDFDGDGVWDSEPPSYSNSIQITYFRPGTYRPRIELRDSQGLVTTAQTTVTVTADAPAEAQFIADPRVGSFSTEFLFDASATNPGKAPVAYRWVLDAASEDDIRYDTSWSTTPLLRHRYTSTGEKLVKLTVKHPDNTFTDYFATVYVHPSSPAVDYLLRNAVMYSEAPPDGLVSRAELAALLPRAAGVPESASPIQQRFTDIPTTYQFAGAIEQVTKRGWMSGDSRYRFRPDEYVTRAAAVTAAVYALYPRVAEEPASPPAEDVPLNRWFTRAATLAIRERLIPLPEKNQFQPAEYITRGDLAVLLANLMERYDARGTRYSYNQNSIIADLLALLP